MSVSLYECKISQTALNLKANQFSVIDCTFNEESLESIDCETLYISGNRQQIILPLKSKATRKVANLKGCALDLAGVAQNWTELKCEECEIIRNYNLIEQWKERQNQISNQQSYFANLVLTQCKLYEIDQLVGKWKQISIIDCDFECQNGFSQKIMVGTAYVDSTNFSNFSCFQAQFLIISNCAVNFVPQKSVLVFDRCLLSFSQKQTKVSRITVKNCKLNKFRISLFPDIKYIQFCNQQNEQYQNIVINFVKSQKISKCVKQSLSKRRKQQLNRIIPKRSLVLKIQLSHSLMYETFQQLDNGYE
ncbi:Hypothetical_protein [Hexamita inflata]|uniref:Hypothetical_protein n=1 Tax=Hexamita inflata TaxID=28002 RepID=A0AA86U9F3_9EUKA|nr:Hypothetical protein HINF_LOCUS31604 [Hexamita inflata]CAI9943961.1 Hypothetical protein HINF_LOCUS31606 [Hexamita inflata]